ncbi:MAG: IS4 family transposase [Desulfobulbaceae bacterium]|nr:IS4 family transposase [Desulfobulbaceae bacterium]
MSTINNSQLEGNNKFDVLASSFLQEQGLPFSKVLDANHIHQVFQEEDALFGQEDIYSTEIILWAFLAQTLHDGKSAACSAAVADIATYMLQTGQQPPSGNTGDYCRSRAKLKLSALKRLVRESGSMLESNAEESWLFKNHHAKLVDGFTFTMPDTPENQQVYPQQVRQAEGIGFPIARACAVISLATACVCDIAIGPYAGKETGETALLREIIDIFDSGDIAVFDRCYSSYMMFALLMARDVDVCTRLHQFRKTDFRKGRQLGKNDYLITWQRPQCPTWMSSEQYEQIPETLTLREIRYKKNELGKHEPLTVVTTLVDSDKYSKEEIANLYGHRWNVELDIYNIKQTLNLNHLRCKTPEMIHRELWVTLLAYNMIRKVIVTSASLHDKQPRRLSFTLTCQIILSSWILVATGSCWDMQELHANILKTIAKQEIPYRPNRIEPRVVKRRCNQFKLMTKPRQQLREELEKT